MPLKRNLTESQIVVILKPAEFGKKVNDICRELGISSATFKRMYADMALENQTVKDLLGKL